MRAARYIWAIAFAAGCAPDTDLRIDPGELTSPLAFLVEIRGSVIDEISMPFGLSRDDPFGMPALTVEDDSEVYLVDVDLEALRSIVPNLQVDRRNDFRLRAGAPPRAPDIYVDPVAAAIPEAAYYRVGLEERGGFVRTTRDEQPTLRDLTLDVPADPAFCRDRLGGLGTFGARTELLTPRPGFLPEIGKYDALITELLPLAADRALVMTSRLLAIVDEGGTIEPPAPFGSPTQTFVADEHPGNVRLRDVALVEDGDPRRVVAVGVATASVGVVLDFVLEAEGLRLTSSTTTAADGSLLPALLSVAVGPDGTMVAGGREGHWVSREPSASLPAARGVLGPMFLDEDGRRLVGVVPNVGGTAPFLLGVRADAVYELDPATGDAALTVLRMPNEAPIGVPPTVRDLTAAADGSLQMVVGSGSLVQAREPPGDWTAVPTFDVPDLEPCTLGLPLDEVSVRYQSVAIGDEQIFVSVHACAGVITVSRNDGCIAVLPVPGEVVHLTPQFNLVQTVRLGYGRLFVGGDEGRLVVLD